MVIRKPFWVAVFLLAVSILAYVIVSDVVFKRAAYVIAILIAVSYIWALFSTRGVSIRRYVRGQRQQVGQILNEHFELMNQMPIVRLWLEIRDESEMANPQNSRVVSWVGRRAQRSYLAPMLLLRRGIYTLGPTSIFSGDPFGFFANKSQIPAMGHTLVLPYYEELKYFPSPAGLLQGGKARRDKSLEVTPYAAGVREYHAGDPLSRIHWRTTARHNKLMVKEFERDPQANAWILLDADREKHAVVDEIGAQPVIYEKGIWAWQKRPEFHLPADSFEYQVSAAASVANYYLKQGKSVGFACAAQNFIAIPPERGERQFGKIMETLALVKCEGELPFTGLIESQATLIPRGSTVTLVTSSNDAHIFTAIDILRRRDLRPVIVLVDPASFGRTWGSAAWINQARAMGVTVKVFEKGAVLSQALS